MQVRCKEPVHHTGQICNQHATDASHCSVIEKCRAWSLQALYKELERRDPATGRMTSPSVTADTITRPSRPQQHGSADGAAEPPAPPRLSDAATGTGDQPAEAGSAAAPDASAEEGSGRRPPTHWWEQPVVAQVWSPFLLMNAFSH